MKKSILLLVLSLFLTGDCTRVKKQIIPLFEGIAPQEDGGLKVANNSSTLGKIESISVTPPTATIAKDTKTNFKATAIYSDGSKVDITDLATWSTDAENTATAAPKGIATGKSAGNANVTATYEALTGKGGLKVTDATVTAIQVSRPENIDVGTSTNLKAVAILSDGTTQDVTNFVDWGSTSPAVTVSNDESSKGKTTGSSAGQAPVTASLNGVTGSSSVTVVQRTLVGISIDASTTIIKGSQKTYKATAIYSDESTQDVTNSVTWSSSNTEIVGFNSADASIKNLATGLATGAAVITATLNGVSGTSNLTVISPKLVSITVEAVGGNSIAKGTNKQFKAIATFEDGSTLDVTDIAAWTSSDTNTVGMANASGKSGLAYGLNQGTAVVTATLGGKSGSANLTVTEAALVSISISGGSSIQKGTTQQFTATGVYTDGSSQDITNLVTWTSSNTVTSSVSNIIGTNGKAYGDAAGTTNITASLNGVASSALPLTVNGATLTSISVTPANPSVSKGSTQAFTATGIYSDNTTQNITSLVTWSSSDTSKATISNASDTTKGKATTLAAGSATITASLDGKSGTASLTVTPATLVSIAVTSSNPSVIAGSATPVAFTAIGTYSDGTTQDITSSVTWASSDTSKATISNVAGNNGKATGVAAGSTNITATFPGSGITSPAVALTVNAATLQSIAITPVNPTNLIVGGAAQAFTAMGTYDNGQVVDITSSVTWNSSTGAATISNAADATKGKATGATAGSTNITASLGGVTSNTVALTSVNATLQSIAISPVSPSALIAGSSVTQAFTAMGTYNVGAPVDITSLVTWNSSTGAATISNSADATKGKATPGATAGSTNITASLGGVTSNTVALTVNAATLQSIAISPVNPTNLIVGSTPQAFTAMGTYDNGQVVNITSSVTWNSATQAAATISNVADATKGKATAVAAGSTNISASLSGINSNTVALTVVNPTLLSIQIDPPSPSVAKGSTQQFTATGTYNVGSPKDLTNDPNLTWTSSDSTNTPISNAAGSKGLVTTGQNSAASVTVSVTYTGFSGTITPATLTVTPATLSKIDVTPATASIAKGTNQQFIATGTYSDNSTQVLTNDAKTTWTTSDANTSVSNTAGAKGLVGTGQNSAASVTVSVTYTGFSGIINPATLTVTPATLSKIDVTPATASIAKGTNQQFVATGTYSDNSTQVLTNDVKTTWTTSDANTSVSNTAGAKGLVGTGQNSAASVTVSVTYTGFSGTINPATLTVTPATLSKIDVTPATASVNVNLTQQFVATGTYSDNSTQVLTTDANIGWTSSTSKASISNAAGSKGLATGVATGTSNISVTYTGFSGTINPAVLTIGAATSSSTTVGNYSVTVPTGINTTTAPTGNFTGTTYNTANNAAGFISVIPDYTTSPNTCQAQGTAILNKIINDAPNLVTVSDQISSSTTNFTGGCSITYNLALTTNASKKATEVSDHLISNVGVNTSGGSVSNLPVAQGSETASTSFRAIVRVTYKTGANNQIIGIGVSNAADYPANEALLVSFLDGTNVAPAGTTYLSKTDSFTGVADPKVDFIWVVDNSSSMSAEQSKVQTNAATFFTKLSTKHLDFRLGVITTGSTELNTDGTKCTMTPSGHKAWELWGTGWTTSANGSSAFVDNVSTVGNTGCGSDETAPFFMERALGVHTGVSATVLPRSGAKLIFVILSDEGDGYSTMAGKSGANAPSTTFSATSNTFVTNNYKVYSIIGIYDGSVTVSGKSIGQPGRCDSNPSSSTAPKATSANNDAGAQINYDLAAATGGSSSTICTPDYSAILDNIATQAAASSSSYILSKTPQSSSITVKVGGVTVSQDSTNGWQYNSSNNSIVFSGTAWPAAGAAIEVTYQYTSDQGAFNIPKSNNEKSSLLAFISKAGNNNTAKAGILIFLVVGGVLLSRLWMENKKK